MQTASSSLILPPGLFFPLIGLFLTGKETTDIVYNPYSTLSTHSQVPKVIMYILRHTCNLSHQALFTSLVRKEEKVSSG